MSDWNRLTKDRIMAEPMSDRIFVAVREDGKVFSGHVNEVSPSYVRVDNAGGYELLRFTERYQYRWLDRPPRRGFQVQQQPSLPV